MTQEQLNYPRQLTSIIEEKTNFYSHTGDGGSMCLASNDDRIERVWIEPVHLTMDSSDDAVAVRVHIPRDYDPVECMKYIDNKDLDGFLAFTASVFERDVTTLEELIDTLNEIEKKF